MKITNRALASRVEVTTAFVTVFLNDGRTITAPVSWYPRLAEGTAKERNDWRLIGGGRGVHWPRLEEDISVANLLAGQRSNESSASLKRWLAGRSIAARQMKKQVKPKPSPRRKSS